MDLQRKFDFLKIRSKVKLQNTRLSFICQKNREIEVGNFVFAVLTLFVFPDFSKKFARLKGNLMFKNKNREIEGIFCVLT